MSFLCFILNIFIHCYCCIAMGVLFSLLILDIVSTDHSGFLNGIFFYLPEFGFVLYVSGFRSCVLCFRSCVCVFVCLLQPGSQLLVGLQTQSSRQTFVFCTTLCAPERKSSQRLIFITKVANIWLTLFIWAILAMFITAIKRLLSSDTSPNFNKNPERFFTQHAYAWSWKVVIGLSVKFSQ